MHLKQPGFTYSACGPFTKNKKRIQKFKDTGYIYKDKLDKACFDMAYGDFKDLTRRIASDKGLRDKAFNIVKNPKYDVYQRGIASMVYKFFDKKSKGSGVNIKTESNEKLAEELHKQIIRDVRKTAVYSRSKDHIREAYLVDMQLINKFNKGFKFLLCVFDIFSKHA